MSDGVDHALSRARLHFSNATREGIAGAAAILDAGGRASGLNAEQAERLAEAIAGRLEKSLAPLRDGSVVPEAVFTPLDEALQAEIGRWEARSRRDPDARAVLRAFLGLRECLWELSQPRREAHDTNSARKSSSHRGSRRGSSAPGQRRVQRFEVED